MAYLINDDMNDCNSTGCLLRTPSWRSEGVSANSSSPMLATPGPSEGSFQTKEKIKEKKAIG